MRKTENNFAKNIDLRTNKLILFENKLERTIGLFGRY